MNDMQTALQLYQLAHGYAVQALEARAVAAMKAAPQIKSCCIAHGVVTFHDRRGEVLRMDRPASDYYGGASETTLKAMRRFQMDAMDPFACMFDGEDAGTVKLTKAGGKIERLTDW